eukprot:jgi/Tetstr1/436508/TSEL_025334.t1
MHDAGVDVGVAAVVSVAAKVSTSRDGVGRLSSGLLALCEATFRLGCMTYAFGSDGLGQLTLDLLSSSLTAQTLKSYAGRLSHFAEFCHDSENISPLEATTATVVRRLGTKSNVVLDYIDPNVLPSLGAWCFFGHDIAPLRHIQVQQDSAAVAFPVPPS